MAEASARPPSCGDWLSVLRPRLQEPLFDSGAVARLRRLAGHLPGNFLGVLEVRLGQNPGPVDLSLRVKRGSDVRPLAERLPSPHVRAFLSRWSEPDGPFAPSPAVWIELDLHREPDEIPPPVICARLPPDAGASWLLDTLLPALHGRPLADAQREQVRLCHEAIPHGASLLYAFSLLSRGSDAVRMELFGLSPAAIPGYLSRVAPRADTRAVEMAPLFEGVERVHLSFDIGSEVLPRIGIEGSFPRLPRREPGWAELFERLVERGLCAVEKRDAALAWPGYDTFWTAPEAWPFETAGAGGRCVRALSHVKVVCEPGREPEAKVYLAFGPLGS